jgi:hypothetical protein
MRTPKPFLDIDCLPIRRKTLKQIVEIWNSFGTVSAADTYDAV